MGEHKRITDPAIREAKRKAWLESRALDVRARLVKGMPTNPKHLFQMLVRQVGSVKGVKEQRALEKTKHMTRRHRPQSAAS